MVLIGDVGAELASVVRRVRRFRSVATRVETTPRDPQSPAERRDRKLGPLRFDPDNRHAWFLAKKAARSSVVRPVFPVERSARACRTQFPNAEGVRSSSRDTAPMVFPSSTTNRTAPALNSSVNPLQSGRKLGDLLRTRSVLRRRRR